MTTISYTPYSEGLGPSPVMKHDQAGETPRIRVTWLSSS